MHLIFTNVMLPENWTVDKGVIKSIIESIQNRDFYG